MTMTSVPSCTVCVTVCSWLDLRLPVSLALARSLWIAAITSFCWPMNASPILTVVSRFSLIIESTCGNATSDLTDASQGCFSSSFARASSLSLGLALTQRSQATISTGYVEAIRICEISESGYRAMEATSCSISSGLKSGLSPAGGDAPGVAGAGVWAPAAGGGAGLGWAVAGGGGLGCVAAGAPGGGGLGLGL